MSKKNAPTDRAEALEALKQQLEETAATLHQCRKDYETLFSNMTEAFGLGDLILDSQGQPVDFRLLETNPAFERDTGLTGDILGRPSREWDPDQEPSWLHWYSQVAQTGKPASFDIYSAYTARHYEVHCFSPAPGKFAFLTRDITDRVRTEAALQESQRRYNALFNASTNGITHMHVITDGQGKPVDLRVEAINEACERIVGIRKAETEGKRVTELFPGVENFDFDFISNYAKVALEGEEQTHEVFFPPSEQWLSIYVHSPAPGECTTIFRDITAEKNTREALHRQRSQLQAILDNSDVLIALTDVQGRIVIANEALNAVLSRRSIEPLVGQQLINVLPVAANEVLWPNVSDVLHAEAPVRTEVTVPQRNGGERTYLTVRFPVRDRQTQELYGVGLVATDITKRKRAEHERERLVEQLRAMATSADRNRAQMEAVFQSIREGISVYDMEGNLIMLNTALWRFSGFASMAEMKRPVRGFAEIFEFWLPDGTPVPYEDWPANRVLRGELIDDLQLRGRRNDINRTWYFSFSGAPVLDENGKQVMGVVSSRDITESKRTKQARQEAEERLQLAVSIAKLGFWEWTAETGHCYYSPQWKAQLGYGEDDLAPRREEWISRLHPEDRESVLAAMERFLARPGTDFRFQYRLRDRQGKYHWMEANAIVGTGAAAGDRKLIGTQLDVTETKQAEQRVREAVQHDTLTGLPNRALIFEYAGHLLAAARRNHARGAFLFIDLDRFKPINDLYGHDVGDRLLTDVAQRITACVRDEDLVGRLGGDEFIIVLHHVGEGYSAGTVAQHVLDALSRPFEIDDLELSISASVGISHYPQHGSDVDALIHTADLAMYHSKQAGRGHYQIYTPDLDSRVSAASSIETRLKRALQGDGLALHYQPVIDMRSGRVVGVEALLRLIGGGPTDVGPERFIPIAESTGLIGPLGEWVVAEACRQHEAWRREGLDPVTIAVNVSPLQFRQRGFRQRLEATITASGADPRCLQLEVTESTVMDNVEESIQTLAAIRDMGVLVALDDFGTGYSSLSQLSILPLDKLKADQSFVRRLENNRASRAITEAIIALGRTLNLEVVGEGIESQNVLEYLQEHGCDQAQGYYISRPLPAAEFTQWYGTR